MPCQICVIILIACLPVWAQAQVTIKGTVNNRGDNEPLIGASVVVKETGQGTVTDFDGSFEIENVKLPATLTASYVGFTAEDLQVTEVNQKIAFRLEEETLTFDVVEVKGRRISEKQQQAPLTVETLDNIAIKETAAANFYDGLGALKDVDLTAASLGFKIINTRGFNSTSPVRSLQIIDGVDNQSPGLNFSLGNFLGASELDINRVNLIVGASSAFYGPNAFNGVISMETKNPFLHKGLSAMLKGGERNLVETGIRWADALKNKEGHEFFAYKINAFYFRANDWVADNYDPVYESESTADNPGGYDAVNIYGDEYQSAYDLDNSLALPGIGTFHRRGYREIDLVDYDSRNLKLGTALHFRLAPEKNVESPEIIVASNFSTGTTVYQGDNRFSLRDIKFYQHRIELKKQDHYFLRTYVTHEDAGNSFDPYFTALKLQESARESRFWGSSYLNFWQLNVVPELRRTEGFPRVTDFIGRPDDYRKALNGFLGQPSVQNQLLTWHQQAQAFSNTGAVLDNSRDFYEPGSPAFTTAFNDITSRLGYSQGGTRFFDKSALAHVHGEYQFKDLVKGDGNITNFDWLVGANGRLYMPNSKGSILLDTAGRDIDTYEFGLYTGGTMELASKLRLSASLRMDKNQNFDFLFSPAASAVYNPNPDNTLRMSFSSAIRNPTLADQYLFYNVGRAILIGNLDGFNNLITVESFGEYVNTLNTDTLQYFNVAPIRPEKVKTVEAGYRTTLFDRVYLDATYYYSFYRDFIGYNLGIDATVDRTTGLPSGVQAYRVAANATDRVTTQGFSIGANLYFAKYFVAAGNYSWNKLNTLTDDPIIPAFNTPENKYNLSISGRDVPLHIGGLKINNLGFNVNYKWIQGFIFEGSPQFTGLIPTYDLLDAQINWSAPRINTTFKLGASNILNNETFQTYGGPRIGRLTYLSVLYDWKKR